MLIKSIWYYKFLCDHPTIKSAKFLYKLKFVYFSDLIIKRIQLPFYVRIRLFHWLDNLYKVSCKHLFYKFDFHKYFFEMLVDKFPAIQITMICKKCFAITCTINADSYAKWFSKIKYNPLISDKPSLFNHFLIIMVIESFSSKQ